MPKTYLITILICSALIVIATQSTAQPRILFSEDFENMPGSTAGGAGTYSFPNGWLLANVDNGTPAPQTQFVNEAWERREDFTFDVDDSCAFSTSWNNPAGQSDDWMWTPPIVLSGSTISLRWNAVAYDPSFPDGYEVRVMTIDPIGGNGNIGNMLSSTPVFTIAAENPSWTARSVDLSAYAGQTIHIAFRNTSFDKFLLLIDDIVVETPDPTPWLFREDFDDISGSNLGGRGTYRFPTGWRLANVDNGPPGGSVQFVNEAWERLEDFNFDVDDSCAFSTSFYSTTGQADDWMWTPPIPLTGTRIRLSWNAVTYDASFPEGYEIRIMTEPPTGVNGSIGNMLSASTQVFNINAENTFWTARSVDISSYTGNTVYISFRNNSTDKFLLLIDDIIVEDITSLPVTLVNFYGSHSPAGNLLQWTVSQQDQILSYDIERSNGQSAFSQIGSVTANTNTDFTYQFTDAAPQTGNNFYRIKIAEFSAEVRYSKTIVIQNNNNNISRLQIFPNPAKDVLHILLNENSSNNLIEINDVAGRKVKTIRVPARGNISLSVDISMLSRGIYYLKTGNEVKAFYKE